MAFTVRQIKIGHRRLLRLASFLMKLPQDRFDFSTYVGPEWKGREDLSCGTTACAMGWATVMPEFRKLGLRLSQISKAPYVAGGAIERDPQDLFYINADDYYFLFIPNGSHEHFNFHAPDEEASAARVAAHICHFVKIRRDRMRRAEKKARAA